MVRGTDRILRDKNIRLIALEQDILYKEAAGIYNKSLTLEELTKQAEAFPIITEADKANMIRNGVDEASVINNQKLAAEMQATLEARTAEVATIGKQGELFPTKDWLPSDATSATRLERTREIETMLNEYMKADAQGVLSVADKANEARLAAEYAHLNKVENFDRLIKEAGMDDLGSIAASIGKSAEAIRKHPDMEGMISGSTKIDDAVKAETAALSTEAAEATAAARIAAGDMYPNVAGTGMVTSQAADLSKLPNFSRLAKAAEIDDLARISKTAETAKAAELGKGTELATVSKAGELAKTGGELTKTGGELTKAAEIAANIESKAFPFQTVARTTKLAETAGNTTTAIGLQGDRGADGSLYPYPTDVHPDISDVKPPVKEAAPAIKSISRPGWMQGNTHAPDDGNWWSADFDDEHWNTPAGVNEAISIWGRPIGTRHSWETPAAIQNQYTYRQKPDWSWMDEYN
jgi:hypothetical protein